MSDPGPAPIGSVQGAEASDGGRQPLGGRSLAASIGLHALALAAVVWVLPALRSDPTLYRVVELRVVSAPPPPALVEEEQPPAPEEDLVVEVPDDNVPVDPLQDEPEPEPTPDPEVAEPDPESEPEPAEDDSDPDSLEAPVETPAPEPEETAPPSETPAPAASEDEQREDQGIADLQVRQEGFQADYPEYFSNIVRQVKRCLRTRDSRAAATVRFVVERDGGTAEFAIVESSGRRSLDFEVLGAVECAGRPGRMGPLPDDYAYDVLPITLVVSLGNEH